jgi:ketosteroid isomerase-like protein
MSPAERISPVSVPVLASRRVLLAATALAAAGSAQAQPSGDPTQLLTVMERYAVALRWNNVDALVALYTADGVFMRENLPPAVGTEALRAAYRQVFATLKLDLRFDIQQTEVSEDIAWLRATSKGQIRTLATAADRNESFNDLVVFGRERGTWKIRCYLYASNRPGTGTPQ